MPERVTLTGRQKSRYTDRELKSFKRLIEKKLKKAVDELQFYKTQLSDLADNQDSKVKGLDDGVGTIEAERLSTLAGRTQKHITHLENALIRIENKVYGICRVTGKLITKDRLMAVPHATLSIEAKEARDR